MSQPFESAISFQVATLKIVNETGFGSGIILDEDNGIIATCAHVVGNSKSGEVRSYLVPRPIQYEVIERGDEEENDVALLKANLSQLRNGDFLSKFTKDVRIRSSAIGSGEAVMLCGYPDVLTDSSHPEEANQLPVLTWGITSTFPMSEEEQIIVSASILPGNSGGPCFDSAGYLLGLASASSILGALEVIAEGRRFRRVIPATERTNDVKGIPPVSVIWALTTVNPDAPTLIVTSGENPA